MLPTPIALLRLKARQLSLVVAIHDLGSIRKASEHLQYTQPSATLALAELEASLGVQLFVRTRSGMKPTHLGELIARRARRILADLETTIDEVRQANLGESREVFIGALPASAMTVVPSAIIRLRAEAPNIVLRVVEGSTQLLLPALEKGELDLVIGRVPSDQLDASLSYEPLKAEISRVICRTGHRLASRKKISLSDVAREEWILPDERSHLRAEFRKAFVADGLQPPDPVIVTSSASIRIAVISRTDMLGILTQRAAIQRQNEGILRVLDVDFKAQAAPMLIVTRADGLITPAVATVIEHLREAEQ